MHTTPHRRQRVTADRAAEMLRLLVVGACSRAQLAEQLSMQPSTVSAWIDALRSQSLVRLCGWENDARGYPTIELFEWAPALADATKQVRTRAEQMRDWRASKRGGVAS